MEIFKKILMMMFVVNLNLSMTSKQDKSRIAIITFLTKIINKNVTTISQESTNYDLTADDTAKIARINDIFHDVMLMLCLVFTQATGNNASLISEYVNTAYRNYAKHCMQSNIFDENTIKQSFQNAIKKIINKNQIKLHQGIEIQQWFSTNPLPSIDDIVTPKERQKIQGDAQMEHDMLRALS